MVKTGLAADVLPLARKKSFWFYFSHNKALYVMLIPGILNLILFKYVPMYGIIIAFQSYYPAQGILHSPWVGFRHFVDFVTDPYFYRIIRNTIVLGVLSLVISFPMPIIFALLLNELRGNRFKRVTQTISYMPYFLSGVVVIGLLRDMVSPSTGSINVLIKALGGTPIEFIVRPEWFRFLYIVSGIWQGIGFGSIIYLAAISGVNPELYESAVIDGAGRFAQVRHITIPSILPTIAILFILSVGGILGNDFQKILLMYSPLTYETADVMSTYMYRMGIESAGSDFSYASAVGLFTAVISLFFLTITNRISKSLSEYSLW